MTQMQNSYYVPGLGFFLLTLYVRQKRCFNETYHRELEFVRPTLGEYVRNCLFINT